MTEFNKIFIDTAPFIYFLDNDVVYGNKVKNLFENLLNNNKQMVTSVVTCEEYLVYPYRMGNKEKEDVFFEFINDCCIEPININVDIAKIAAQIRANYTGFKGMDSLQLAVALYSNCDVFLTNDRQLRQFSELRCVTIDEWE